MKRFGVSMEEDLLDEFDKLVERKGYANRSQAIRDAVRCMLGQEAQEDMGREAFATLTTAFDHHKRGINEKLTAYQHSHLANSIATLHIHLTMDDCMEISVFRGKVQQLIEMADTIQSTKGVKYAQLNIVPPKIL